MIPIKVFGPRRAVGVYQSLMLPACWDRASSNYGISARVCVAFRCFSISSLVYGRSCTLCSVWVPLAMPSGPAVVCFPPWSTAAPSIGLCRYACFHFIRTAYLYPCWNLISHSLLSCTVASWGPALRLTGLLPECGLWERGAETELLSHVRGNTC